MPTDIELNPKPAKKVGEKGDVEVYVPFEGFYISGEYTVLSEEVTPKAVLTPKYTTNPLDTIDLSIFK